MTDEELLAAFESTDLPADAFTHEAHVRVAWCYLRRASLPEALHRFSTALRRFADAKGATGKYNETITVAYLLVIADRIGGAPQLSWTEFAAANPDLFARPAVIERYFSPTLLASARTQVAFVSPDGCVKAAMANHRGLGMTTVGCD